MNDQGTAPRLRLPLDHLNSFDLVAHFSEFVSQEMSREFERPWRSYRAILVIRPKVRLISLTFEEVDTPYWIQIENSDPIMLTMAVDLAKYRSYNLPLGVPYRGLLGVAVKGIRHLKKFELDYLDRVLEEGTQKVLKDFYASIKLGI